MPYIKFCVVRLNMRLVRDELCEMSGVNLWCEMRDVRLSGVGWVVWNELCEICRSRFVTKIPSPQTSIQNAAIQICRKDISSANENMTAATEICHRDTPSANTDIIAAKQICHKNTSSANTNLNKAIQILRWNTSSANAKKKLGRHRSVTQIPPLQMPI